MQGETHMQILTQIIILIILSVITHYIIAWAGSQLNEVGVVSREYANFTFRADRHGVMTTNILMNIFVPNVAMIFVFVWASHAKRDFITHYIVLYLVFYYLYRMVLICLILRRRELYSVRYELPIALVGIGIGELINQYFLKTQEVLLITPSELREELWFAIILIMYEFCKKIMDTRFKQDNVLKVEQLDKYIVNKFKIFYKRYSNCFETTSENNYMCIFVYAVMIFEDFNRGPEKRLVERLKHKVTGSGTLGIMQVESEKIISDKESVRRAYSIISEFWGEEKNRKLERHEVYNYAVSYNPDEDYANSIEFIYSTLEHFIEQSAGWSSRFFIETEHDDAEENVDVSCEVTEYTCHSMKEFADVLKNDCRIVLDFAESNILDGIYDTENIRVEGCQGSWQLELCDLSNVEIVGKHTGLISDKAGADVLTLRNCYNVKVSDVVLGHNIEMGSCDGVVVSVVGGYGVTLDSVEMYGCGTYGVYGRDGNVEIINCDIHDCSIGAINLEECICIIENTKMHNCIHAYDSIITSNTELTLVNIEIYDNITEHAIVSGVKYLTNFKDVYIHHNKYRKNPLVLMRQDGVRWEKNEQLPWL